MTKAGARSSKSSSSPPEDLVPVGVVGRPHGIRGEVRLKLHNPTSAALHDAGRLWLLVGGTQTLHELESARESGARGLWVVSVAGCDSVEQAEMLRGAEVSVPKSDLPPLEEGEHYISDLIGVPALDDNGQRLGTVIAVEQYPSADCLVVETPGGERREPPVLPGFATIDASGAHVVVHCWDDLPPILPPKPPKPRKKPSGRKDPDGASSPPETGP